MNVAAIETAYKGYRFRSRLEARWAVFFDALGLRWEYEKEGFGLPSGRYLPDFWLPTPWGEYPAAGLWVEIKGIDPTGKEMQLLDELCFHTKHTSYIMQGLPFEHKVYSVHHSDSAGSFLTFDGHDLPDAHYGAMCLLTRFLVITRHRIDAALIAARSARFEFGEQGAR